MTVQEAIRAGTAYLSPFGIDNPRFDTELILCDLTRQDRVSLFSHPERQLNVLEETVLWEWLDRRARNYPIQYLRHTQEFYGRDFLVSPSVLIPRPETEILIETCLRLLQQNSRSRSVLDLGTGSGCIAITIACELNRSQIIASDISAGALDIAGKNALIHQCAGSIDWLQADGLSAFSRHLPYFDLIVSNPPYVSNHDVSVGSSVAIYEPGTSVYAGNSGYEMYEHLLSNQYRILKDEGYLVLELGYQQAEEVCRMAETFGWILIQMIRDLAGIERCVVLTRS